MNNKFYYGVHSTENINDGYLGSGNLIIKAVKKYGSSNFKKEILKYFSSVEEMYLYEKMIVNKELVKDKNCYNIIEGGIGSSSGRNNISESLISFWNTKDIVYRKKHGEKSRLGVSKEGLERSKFKNVGYECLQFKKLWESYFNLIEDDFINYTSYTDLPDKLILEYLINKYGKSFKMPSVFDYLEYKNKIRIIEKTYFKDVTTFSSTKSIKTLVEPIVGVKKDRLKIRKIKKEYFNSINEILPYIFNINYSDSYIDQNILVNKGVKLHKIIEYLEYLELVDTKKIERVNIRGVTPNAQRKTGRKTIISLKETRDIIYILEGDFNNEYRLSVSNNGEDVSIMWGVLGDNERRLFY